MKIHPAEEAGMSRERLARKVNAYLESAVADDRLPGIIALAAAPRQSRPPQPARQNRHRSRPPHASL